MSRAAVHLELLAAELSGLGLVCDLRYRERPMLLRVTHPCLPVVGESVRAEPVAYGGAVVWWFRCSSGRLLAPCADLPRSACAVVGRLSPYVPELAELGRELRASAAEVVSIRDMPSGRRYRPTW